VIPSDGRLRKHADYQRVYRVSRKNFGKLLTYFYRVRVPEPAGQDSEHPFGPRIGLTVGRVMGNAVTRNRIKRRVREAVRSQIGLLDRPVDVVLHPGRRILESDFSALEKDIASIFRTIQNACKS
jgi:ribonuclease P protein component